MLTWDEEVKPTSLNHFARTPTENLLAAAAQNAPEFRTLHDGVKVSVPSSLFDAKPKDAATPRRVQAADKRIINGKTDVNQ